MTDDVPAFEHSVAQYVNGGIEAGLTISSLHEASGPADETPRLLVVTFMKATPQ